MAITATGTFYHQRSHAAWPVVLTVGYGITVGLNAAFDSNVLKETANADSRNWLYSNRELRVRGHEYDEAGNRTLLYSVDAQAEAAQDETYDASGTDTKLSPPPSIPTTSSTTA